MAYASPDDVRSVLAPGRDTDASTAASMSDGDLQAALDDAATEIDSRLRGRVATPLDPVPGIAKDVNRDIAAYLATLTFRRGDPLPPEDPVRLRYMRATGLLDRLAKGEIEIAETPASEAAVVNSYDGELFSERSQGLVADSRGDVRVAYPASPNDPYYQP